MLKKVLILVLAAGAFWGLWLFQGMVRADEACKGAWGVLETALEKRMAAAGELASEARRVAGGEAVEAARELGMWRQRWGTAKGVEEKWEAAGGMDRAAAQLAELTAGEEGNSQVAKVRSVWEESAGKVEVARENYDKAVREYNAQIRSRIGVWLAEFSGMEKRREL